MKMIKSYWQSSSSKNYAVNVDIKWTLKMLIPQYHLCDFAISIKESTQVVLLREYKESDQIGFSGLLDKHNWNFKPKISSIIHFWLVKDGWISHILYVKAPLVRSLKGFQCLHRKWKKDS